MDGVVLPSRHKYVQALIQGLGWRMFCEEWTYTKVRRRERETERWDCVMERQLVSNESERRKERLDYMYDSIWKK